MTPHNTQEKFNLSLLKSNSASWFLVFFTSGSLAQSLKAEPKHLGETHHIKVPIEWASLNNDQPQVANDSDSIIAEYLSLNDLGGQGSSIFPPVRERYQIYLA